MLQLRPHVTRWLQRFWSPTRAAQPEPQPTGSQGSSEHTRGLASLEQQITKVARAQAKLSVRQDDIVEGLAGLASGLERLTATVALSAALPSVPSTPIDPSPVLDALDRLEDARRVLAADRPEVEAGLAALGTRLEAWLASVGVERLAACGVPVDPVAFRVIGIESCAGAADGEITRVVRAAARRGTELLREGEVLVAREVLGAGEGLG